MKVLLDSNVIIAAFATQGLCHLVFETTIAQHQLILSKKLLLEVQKNFKTKIKLPQARIKEIIGYLSAHAIVHEDKQVPGLRCRDASDLMVLSLALNAKANAIVSGDQDLLVLKRVGDTVILSPRGFWNLLNA